jgi:hypothetical protein
MNKNPSLSITKDKNISKNKITPSLKASALANSICSRDTSN